MKKYILILSIASLLLSCGNNKDVFTLKGEFDGLDAGQFIIFSYSPKWNKCDTITINNGKFEYFSELSDTLLLTLQYPNFMQTTIIGMPGILKLKGKSNELLTLQISGDHLNEELSQWRKDNALKKDSATILAANYIKKHPDSWVSIALFHDYFVMATKQNQKEAKNLLLKMIKSQPKNTQLKHWERNLIPFYNIAEGNTLPMFSLKTLRGENITNKDFKGKELLINIWSTWSYDLKGLTPKLKDFKKENPNLEIISISLDVDTSAVRRIMEQDSVPGYMCCDQKAWHSPLVKVFGIKSLPMVIYVNKQGKIEKNTKYEINLNK